MNKVDAPAPFRIVSRIYEGDKKYPAVVHIFYGKTITEANGYLQAHLKTDAFFRGCVTQHRFATFECREDRVKQRWNGETWVAFH